MKKAALSDALDLAHRTKVVKEALIEDEVFGYRRRRELRIQ